MNHSECSLKHNICMDQEKRGVRGLRKAMVFGVLFLSNVFNINGLRVCRFEPSCTVYATEALSRMPLHQAFFLIIRRLFRCRPFGGRGFDPLPEKKAC